MPEIDAKEKTFRESLFSGTMDLEGMDSLLNLYRELYPERRTFFKPDKEPGGPNENEIAMRLVEGFTILEAPDILSGAGDLAERAMNISRILSRHSEDSHSVITTMNLALADPSSFLTLAETYVRDGESSLREKMLSSEGANPEVIMFVVFNATKGLFLQAAERFSTVSTRQWDHGRCPVCGGEPSIAYLTGEGGKRFLICHRCETHWRFPRLVCPFCEKESPGESGYLFVEEPGYKTMTGQVCDRCKRYIKTWRVESDDLGALHPEVEDLKTPAFDGALESEGYLRGGANIFGVLMTSQRVINAPRVGRPNQ